MRENWWVGVGLLHTLFAREHNTVVEAVKKAHPSFDDQRLFEIGVLVISALIAKIPPWSGPPACCATRRCRSA